MIAPVNCSCGSDGLEALKPSMSSEWHVHCTTCGKCGPKAPEEESAIILWNAENAK